MFDIGRSYSFTMETEHGFGTSSYKVVAWEAPLLKLTAATEAEIIVNTGSAHFHSAKPVGFDAAAPMDINILLGGSDV
jgi:hypothetical protein